MVQIKFVIIFSVLVFICGGSPIEEGDDVTQSPNGGDVDDNFKYPVTPYPDSILDATIPPEPDTPDENDGSIKVVNGPVIVGNKSCQCGTSLKKKIVGGEAVPISELPWTVALVRKQSSRRGPYCGGTLVSTNYVVTASHCVDGFDADKIQIWLNEEDFRVDDETLTGTLKIDVEKIIMHPDYDRRKIDNDIALLRLAKSVDIETAIRPVCLPADNSETYDNEQAIVAGWGATEEGGSVSATLQKVVVPVIPNKVCNWRSLYLGRITDNQLCAGLLTSGGKDSCQGDSGGPLVVNRGDNEQKLLVGVVSYGFGCSRPLAPGVYTRVSRYPKWIVDNSEDADYCST